MDLFVSPSEFFSETVSEALKERKIETYPMVSTYLSELLSSYVLVDQLFKKDDSGKFVEETLAERFLKAGNEPLSKRIDSLKKLGESCLYISGFFGDSLKRKIVDIDYYVDIGGTAYASLSTHVKDDLYSKVYNELAGRFLEFVDVLSLISQKSMIQSNEDLLRLYDRYLMTGSDLARDQLAEKGLLNNEVLFKKAKQ